MHTTLIGTVAGVVALVPQGLVLLLSMAQAVAVIRLGRKQVLVQRLQAVETPGPGDRARLGQDGHPDDRRDRPGEGRAVDRRRTGRRAARNRARRHRCRRRVPQPDDEGDPGRHPHDPGWSVVDRIPFDSTHKYSAVEFAQRRRLVRRRAGGPLPGRPSSTGTVQSSAAEGLRVLLLAEAGTMPGDRRPAGRHRRRSRWCCSPTRSDPTPPTPSSTSSRENVRPKVISGDNPVTVAAIAAALQRPRRRPLHRRP